MEAVCEEDEHDKQEEEEDDTEDCDSGRLPVTYTIMTLIMRKSFDIINQPFSLSLVTFHHVQMMSLCLQPPLFHLMMQTNDANTTFMMMSAKDNEDLRIVGHVKMARRDFFSQRLFHTRDLDPWICHPAPVTR